MKIRSRRVAFLFAWLPLSMSAGLTPAGESPEINASLRGRDYEQTVRLIDAALPSAPAAAGELLMLRKGLALSYQKKYSDAIAVFEQEIKDFPAGVWTDKARMHLADAHMAMKQFDAAERIYARRVEELAGIGRKTEIARVYLDFAEEYFAPKDSLSQPNYVRAKTFFEKALELEPAGDLRESILYKTALCGQKLHEPGPAAQQFEAYLLEFDPQYRELHRMKSGERPLPEKAKAGGLFWIEARLGLGECRLQLQDWAESRRILQDLMAILDAPGSRPITASAHTGGVTPEEARIKAMAMLAGSYRIPNPPDDPNLTAGVQALSELIDRFPRTKEAVQAEYDIGRAYVSRQRTEAAIEAYRSLIERKRIRPEGDEALKLSETLSQEALFGIGALYASQTKYADAIGAWNQYVAKYPSGPRWSAAQQAIIDAEYAIGSDAANAERFDEARQLWNRFLEKYPLDPRTSGILFAFGQMAYREQEKREKAGEAPDWRVAIREWERLVEKSPGTEDAGRAQFMIGQTLQEKVRDLEAAIDAYKKLNWSQLAAAAQQQLAEMRSVRLDVRTDRVFRTNEPVTVHVDTRNVNKLTFKLYRIDMEDYFRKDRTITGVEGLDLLLIDPDQTFDYEVKDYGPFKQISQDVTIPITGPKAYAVYVSNEKSTAEEKNATGIGDGVKPTRLQATTLVIRSDVDIMVKSSRGQMLVFAQDSRRGIPLANVKLLAADTASVILEGLTGEDGFWVSTDKKLKDVSHLSVFAYYGGHIAGTGLSLGGLAFATGLQPRGYIYTDRPAYRPGDSVNIRGILREVTDGAYALPARPEDARLQWKLDVLDAKGRTLLNDTIQLTDFGTFSALFHVSPDAPVGSYKIIARRVDGPSFEGAFEVATYQLAKAFLSFEFTDRVVLRGQRVNGKIKAQYHYGEPVVGKSVEYEIHFAGGDVDRRTGVTDDAGQVAVEFDTTLLPESGTIQLVARQADLDIGAVDAVFVATRDFAATVSAARSLYLSEEPVEVKVATSDLKGEPISRTMTVTAFLRTSDQGRWAESKVEAAEVTTDQKSGVGRATFKLVKGGDYVIRAEGGDARGQRVTAEAAVRISDDADATRLRLFSDRQHYKVGETIALDVHSRIEPSRDKTASPRPASAEGAGAAGGDHATNPPGESIAVLLCEGEGVFHYRTTTIRAGHNTVDLPVDHAHFPNFKLSVAVMAGNQFHQASRDFTVERELMISVKPRKATVRPREELAVDFVVTDQQGRPVSCEIGVGMIDAALLAQYPDGTPKIVPFFQSGSLRSADSRTETSCTFAYRPATTGMVTEVLDFIALAESDLAAAGIPVTASDMPFLGVNAARRPAPNEAAPPAPTRSFASLGDVGSNAAEKPGQSMEQREEESADDGEDKMWFDARDGDQSKLRRIRRAGMIDGKIPGRLEDLMVGGAKFGVGDNAFAVQTLGESLGRDVLKQRFQNKLWEVCQSRFKSGTLDNRVIDLEIGEAVRSAPSRTYYPEVAYWNPHVVTDAAGKATVTIIMPDSSTTWKIIARGATKETLVGDGSADVLSKSEFLVEWTTPPTLIEGDTFTPRGQVHCLTPFAGSINVRYEAKCLNGEPVGVGEKTIESKSGGVFDVAFDAIAAPACERMSLTLSAEAVASTAVSGLSDALTVSIPVQPWGMRMESHVAGVAKNSDFVEVALPPTPDNEPFHDRMLVVAIGASMQRWLIEEALESGDRWTCIDEDLRSWRSTPPRTHADTAAVLLGALYARDYVSSSASTQDARASADRALLEERCAGLVGQLLAAQNDDGGWAWSGKGNNSDPWTTASVAWALGKATADGHSPSSDAMTKLRAYLQKTFADAPVEQTELKAVVLHGLAWIDDIDFGHANRLYRNRGSLSTSALAHLALTFVRLDRNSLAGELLELLAQKSHEVTRRDEKMCLIGCNGNGAWIQSELEVTALGLLAQLSVDARAERVPKMVAYLASTARADGWRPHKAKGPVIAALATYYAKGERERSRYRVAVSVNGMPAAVVESDAAGSAVVRLSDRELREGSQRVDLEFTGRGECAYSVTLSGFKGRFPTPKEARNEVVQAGGKELEPPPLEYAGRQVRRGFATTARCDHFVNRARKVPVGTVVSVSTSYWRNNPSRIDAPDRDYFVVQETIPAGFRLLTDSLSGQFLSRDYADNVLTLYYGSMEHLGGLTYQMVATTPGSFRIPPTLIRSLYRPNIYHLNQDDMTLAVLPRGEQSPDEYQMTPDELYDLGRFSFDDGDFANSTGPLKRLLAGSWLLRDEIYRDTVRMLLTCALKTEDNEAIVNYFEILKEKYADLIIPYNEIVRVAKAYAATGQAERACVIHRATADSLFIRETAVGGVLQQEGRFLDGHDFLLRLWREYPDTPQVESVYFSESQVLYSRSAEAASIAPRRASGTSTTRVTQASLMNETIAMLEAFVTLYPESPTADEASYSLLNAYLDRDDFKTVVMRCDEMTRLFPKSKWLDRFRYMQALAYFNMGDFEKALGLALQVADSTVIDDQGVPRPSPNKWLALYIAGQIYHAQGKIEKAIEFYAQVKSQFSDASEAVGFFERKFVRIPEVTIFHPDRSGYREAEEWSRHLKSEGINVSRGAAQPAPHRQPYVQIEFRNAKDVVLQVYRVDLMKLALLEKNLNQISRVNLSGIKPILEKTASLAGGGAFEDRSIRVPLELGSTNQKDRHADSPESKHTNLEDGAYLVICRSGDQFTSGLVLITPLAVEVQEDMAGGRARVSVVDALTRRGIKNVHVKVIGNAMPSFISGDTDLRGMFLADGLRGAATAIARDEGGHFAFYRSESIAAARLAEPVLSQKRKSKADAAVNAADYRGNLSGDNRAIQLENCQKLQGVFQQQQKGVTVQKAQ